MLVSRNPGRETQLRCGKSLSSLSSEITLNKELDLIKDGVQVVQWMWACVNTVRSLERMEYIVQLVYIQNGSTKVTCMYVLSRVGFTGCSSVHTIYTATNLD